MRAYTDLEGQQSQQPSKGWIHSHQTSIASQAVFSGRFEDFPDDQPLIDGWIFDTPTIDDDMKVVYYFDWCCDLFRRIDPLSTKDAALILLPTNRRGGPFFKSSILETAAQFHGWKACREILWDQGSDYLRSKYPFRKFTVFRRGNKPMQSLSLLRYTDILRGRPPKDNNEHDYAPVPEDILVELLSLFEFKLVCDPFAGTGSLSQAAFTAGVSCISCEIDPDAAERIAEALRRRLPV